MTFEEVNFTFKFQPGIFVSGHDTDRIGRKHNLQDANVKKNVNLHTLIHNTNVTTFLVETCTPFQSDWNGTARFFAAHHHIHNNIAVHVSRRKWAIMQLFRYNDRLLSLLQNPLFTLRFVVLTVGLPIWPFHEQIFRNLASGRFFLFVCVSLAFGFFDLAFLSKMKLATLR